jgi:hypothetical protein
VANSTLVRGRGEMGGRPARDRKRPTVETKTIGRRRFYLLHGAGLLCSRGTGTLPLGCLHRDSGR